MDLRSWSWILAIGLSSCGGGNAAPAGTPSPSTNEEIATGQTLTEFQRKRLLGHYSTRDGASGFILDRTVKPWRAKLDGVAKVVTLAETNEPRRGEKEYASADKSVWLRVDDGSGEVLLFQGPKQTEGVHVDRDADAEQLPAP